MSNFKSFKKSLSKRAAYSELIGYAMMLDSQTVMLKDGSLQAVFRYYGDDVQSTTDDIRYHLSARWSEGATKYWNENVIIESDLIRKSTSQYTDNLDFPDAVSALIDQERMWEFKNAGKIFESQVFITITWHEPKELSRKTKNFIYDSDEPAREKSLKERLIDFEGKLERFTNFVGYGDAEKFMRVKGDEYTSFLDNCMIAKNRKVAAPHPNTFLDAYLSKSDFLDGHVPKLGDTHIKVLSFDGFPNSVHAMFLNSLNSLQIEFRYHLRFIRLTKKQAEKRLKKIKRSWSSKAIGVKGVLQQSFGANPTLNESYEIRKQETEVAIIENEDGQLCYGFFTGSFIFHDDELDNLNLKVRECQRHIENFGFVMREERVHTTDAYLGSLPGHGDNNLRLYVQDSLMWSMTMPLSSVYSGEATCPCPFYPKNSPPLTYAKTDGSNIYRFSNFHEDVGHTVVLGPTSAGKTTFIENMLSQHRKYPESRQIFIGKDQCGKIPILAHGGRFFDLSENTTMSLAPIINLDDTRDFEMSKTWLMDTFELSDVAITPEAKSEIELSLTRLKDLPRENRTLGNLTFQNETLRSTWHSINVGAFRKVLNGTSDTILSNDCIGFDVSHILELKKSVAMPILLAILASLTAKFKDGKPTLLILDEAWILLDHAIFVDKLKDWLKTLRKFNVSVIFSSQSLNDVLGSPIATVVLESCPTKVFLPNGQASSTLSRKHYEDFGLNSAEISLIASATPKREYYIVQPRGRRLIELNLVEVALKFLGVNPLASHPDNKRFYEHFNAENKYWVVDYLRACGMQGQAEFALEAYFKEQEHA